MNNCVQSAIQTCQRAVLRLVLGNGNDSLCVECQCFFCVMKVVGAKTASSTAPASPHSSQNVYCGFRRDTHLESINRMKRDRKNEKETREFCPHANECTMSHGIWIGRLINERKHEMLEKRNIVNFLIYCFCSEKRISFFWQKISLTVLSCFLPLLNWPFSSHNTSVYRLQYFIPSDGTLNAEHINSEIRCEQVESHSYPHATDTYQYCILLPSLDLLVHVHD